MDKRYKVIKSYFETTFFIGHKFTKLLELKKEE